ncbi:MAG: lipoyl protein ligase domain-containing protein [Oscillospiraceae bacterium]
MNSTCHDNGGSYQNICREAHVEALRQRGIPVVRRISGGGTIYCINKNPPS